MLEIDQILQGRYRITRMLGRDGMGAVYEARHIELEMVCVVKEMLPPDDPEVVDALAKQFKREGKILAGLRHPNLPRVSDYFTDSGNYYLVMDLISGQSMDKLIGPQGLPEATVLQYADQLLGVLDYVHAQGVLHRDIKPANIIVQPDGRIVLVNFGLVEVEGGMVSNVSMRGWTPHYAPPEQNTGGTDVRSDLYSLAATLYQALSAQLPTSAADQFAGKPLLSLHQLRTDVRQNTVRVIEKTLQLDRTKRCQSAAEMRAALKDATPVNDNPTVYQDSQRLPEPRTKLVEAPGKPVQPHGVQITVGIMAVVIIGLLAILIVLGLTQKPAAPTALSARLPTWTPVDVTSTAAKNNDVLLTLAPGVTIEMVRIPTGEFLMGSSDSDKDAGSDDKPQNKVMLDEYLIGKYDVTNAQFAAFVKATGYKTTAETEGMGYTLVVTRWLELKGADWLHPGGPGSDLSGKDNHPVVLVSWDDAVAFCIWASQTAGGRKIRLPSEAQWEKAARSNDGRLFPWGNSEPDASKLNYDMNVKDTTEVGKYSPVGDNPHGLADMAGNVWQWTSSLYKPYPYNPNDGREDQSSRDARVLRGGAFNIVRRFVRSAYRNSYNPNLGNDYVGFRVSVSPI